MLAALRDQRYMTLETRKRDGSWIATTVTVVVDDERVCYRTWSKAGKAKRLRNFPDVRLSPCDRRGRVQGPRLCGRACLLEGEDDRRVGSLMNRRYPLLQGILVRYGHKLMRYRTQHYSVSGITPC